MEKINTGIIGFGVTAQVMHAPFLKTSPHYSVKVVLERNKEESKKWFPEAVIVRDMASLLAKEEVELLIITTPNTTHYTYAKEALMAGRHVVVEKPFTIHSTEASELIRLAKEKNRVLSVFHNRRYAADFRTMQEMMTKKLLGEVHEWEGHFNRYRPGPKPAAWREEPLLGSGIFYDLGPHLIDQALCLFGLPQSVTADIRLQRPHARADDYFNIWLHYPFTKVILKGGMLVREPGPRYQVHGTAGSFIKWGDDVQESFLKGGALPTNEDWGREPEEQWGLLHTEAGGEVIRIKYPSKEGHYGLYYHHLYHTLRNGAELREKGEHGYNTIKIIESAFESNRLKKTIEVEGLMEVAYPRD